MKMHWCTANVNLSGQNMHIVQFLATNPVSWPEVQVISALHGDENVTDIKPVRVSDTHKEREKQRLLAKYGLIVEQVFPGRAFQMEMLMPGEPAAQPGADDEGRPNGVPAQPSDGDDERDPNVRSEPLNEPVPTGPGDDPPPDTPPPSSAVFHPTRTPRPPRHAGA